VGHERADPATVNPRPADSTSTESDDEPLARSAAALERSATALRVVAAIGVLGVLWWAQVVVIPVTLSVLISYALEPLINVLGGWRIRRAAAVPLLIIMLLCGAGLAAFELQRFVNHLPTAAHAVASAIQRGWGKPGTMAKFQEAARELENAARSPRRRTNDGVASVRVEEPTFRWSDWLVSGSRNVAQLAAQMFAVVCLTFYLLSAGDLYRRKLVRLVPTFTGKKVTVEILGEIDNQIERVLLARAGINVITGVAVWIAFRFIGLEDALVWGVLAAVLFAIPFAGPTLLVAAAAVAAFVQFGSLPMAGLITAVGIGIGAVEGNLLTPWLMSRAGEMNAVAVFVSLLFWGWLWGAWGLLLALPITAAARVVCERVPALNPCGELLKR
jgi:predicted PurR-regulated permease PerM